MTVTVTVTVTLTLAQSPGPSPAPHPNPNQTIAFFDKHNHFGLPKDQVIFFNQGTMPCFTLDGKLTLSEP